MDIRQVVEDDGFRNVEKLALAPEQGRLQRLRRRLEAIADAAQRPPRQGPVVALETQQLGDRAGFAKPAAGLALARRMQHPRHHDGAGDARVAVAESDPPQDLREAEILQRFQTDPLAADGVRVLVLEAVQIDFRRPRRLLRLFEASGTELAGDGPGGGFEPGIDVEQAILADHLHFNQVAELAPVLSRNGEPGPEIEESDLADFAADALRFDKAEAVGGLAGLGVGFRCFDIHGFRFGRTGIKNQGFLEEICNILALQSKFLRNLSIY